MASVPQSVPAVMKFAPLVIPAPYRGTSLEVQVSAPSRGDDLPVVLFAHGFGWSMHGYAPLVNAWAAAGFVVVQPTFLDSRVLGLTADDPRGPDIWRIRVRDLRLVLDSLQLIEDSVPGLGGRLSHDRIAVAGHSWGAQTASMLLGARVRSAGGESGASERDARVTAGVLLSIPGDGASLTEFAATHFGFMRPDFTAMSAPTLVIAGDHDDSPLSTRGPDWFTDAYTDSPSPKELLTVVGGEHSLGGISGYDVAETTDADPSRVDLVARASSAWLHAELTGSTASWEDFTKQSTTGADATRRLERK